jgi:hypothetical protein
LHQRSQTRRRLPIARRLTSPGYRLKLAAQMRPKAISTEESISSINIACPACRRTLVASNDVLGRQVRCGDCGTDFIATAPSAYAGPALSPSFDASDDHSGKATASLVLGIIGMIGWCLPIIGLPVTITGLVLGCKGLNSTNRSSALAGVILCTIGLILSVGNAAVGAYLGATGQHPLFKR